MIKIGFIGAGAVNFGGHGNKWDHASRLEKMKGITIVGIADPNTERAQAALDKRRETFKRGEDGFSCWDETKVYPTHKILIEESRPDAVFIGVPPFAHGSPSFPLELDFIKEGIHMFIEKPLSCAPPEEMEDFRKQIEEGEKGIIVSVGYMFRYSLLISKMKEMVAQFGPIKAFHARYNCAYSNIAIPSWWNTDYSGGPIVEQATHFIDIGRFFCGDVKDESVVAYSIKATDPVGKLDNVPVDEGNVPEEKRIPRVTSAMWKFENGVVGTLTHSALLHGWNYDLQLELWGDGYYIYARDPYDKCELLVRRPGSEKEELMTFPDDPYLHEDEVFIDAIRTGDRSRIASSYADAFKTYSLTWKIRRGAE